MYEPKFSLERFDKFCTENKNIIQKLQDKSFTKKNLIKKALLENKKNKSFLEELALYKKKSISVKLFFKNIKFVSIDEFLEKQKDVVDSLIKKLQKKKYTDFIFIINRNNLFTSMIIYNIIKDKIKISGIDIDFKDIYLYSKEYYQESIKNDPKFKVAYIYCNDITYSNLHLLTIPYKGCIYTTSPYDTIRGIKKLYYLILRLLNKSFEKKYVNLYLPEKTEYIKTVSEVIDESRVFDNSEVIDESRVFAKTNKFILNKYLIYFTFKKSVLDLTQKDDFKDTVFNKMSDIIESLYIGNQLPNSLEKLVELYPDKDWNCNHDDYHSIFHNPNLTIEIMKNIEKYGNSVSWWEISKHPNTTIEIVKSYPDKPWEWYGLSQNPNITWKIVQENPNIPWDWKGLSRNKNITWDIVEANLDKPWVWDELSLRDDITNEIIDKYPDKDWNWMSMHFRPKIDFGVLISKYPDKDYSWNMILNNKELKKSDLDIVKNNPDKDWNWYNLSYHPNLTWDIVENNLDKNLSWYHLSYIANKDIIKNNINNPKYKWNYGTLSNNKNLTTDIIKDNPDKEWDWRLLSLHTNLTWDFIKENLDKAWVWEFLSVNPIITWDIVKDNLSLPWNWEYLSINPNMSWDIVKNNLDKPTTGVGAWDWSSFYRRKYLQDFYPKSILEKYDESLFEPPWKLVKENLEKASASDKFWHYLSDSKELTWDIVKQYLDRGWNWYLLTKRKDLTLKIILDLLNESKKYPNLNFESNNLTDHPSVTFDVIKANPTLPWNYFVLSANPNITWDIVQSHPNIPWNWSALSANPNITWEIVRDNIDKDWDWKELSKNEFLKDPLALKNYKKKQKNKRVINRIFDIDKRLNDDIVFSIGLYE